MTQGFDEECDWPVRDCCRAAKSLGATEASQIAPSVRFVVVDNAHVNASAFTRSLLLQSLLQPILHRDCIRPSHIPLTYLTAPARSMPLPTTRRTLAYKQKDLAGCEHLLHRTSARLQHRRNIALHTRLVRESLGNPVRLESPLRGVFLSPWLCRYSRETTVLRLLCLVHNGCFEESRSRVLLVSTADRLCAGLAGREIQDTGVECSLTSRRETFCSSCSCLPGGR